MAPQSSYTDLLIVGAGPAGLMAACWASQYNMSTRILDKKPERTQAGHADGLQSRTLEILQSFGFVDPILRQGVTDADVCYWGVNQSTGNIELQDTHTMQSKNLSRYGQILLGQGLIEQVFLDHLQRGGRVHVERDKAAKVLEINPSVDEQVPDFPIAVKVGTSTTHTGLNTFPGHAEALGIQEETIRARYLVGCDGAHSWTREQLGVSSEATSNGSTWGVVDFEPVTDFPNIRQSCMIRSDRYGSIMTVPRERQLVRLYIELHEEVDMKTVRSPTEYSLEDLFQIAEKIMKPYKLSSNYCDWWSIYPIGQRLVKTFRPHERVFLAGDAAHTHSPKGGQGMNVSIQDTYNLTWKLGSVITGVAHPRILDTFESERRPVAEKLMKLDQQLVEAYVAGSNKQNLVEQVRSQSAGFMTGVDITYHPNVLIQSGENDGNNACAEHVRLGMRLPSSPVTSQRDGSYVHLGDVLTSDGSWKLLVFPGDISIPKRMDELFRFSHTFAGQPSLSHETAHFGKGLPALELILIHSAQRRSVNYVDLPCLFHTPNSACCHASKMFADDSTSGADTGLAYKSYGINKHSGCLILCRPDQHVAWTGTMQDSDSLYSHFSRFSAGPVPSSQESEN